MQAFQHVGIDYTGSLYASHSTKRTSEKMSKTRPYLNMIELNTILVEVEAAFISRFLAYPYVVFNDTTPLTPTHFLCGHRLLTLPDTRVSVKESDPDYIPSDISTKEQTKRAKYHELVGQSTSEHDG